MSSALFYSSHGIVCFTNLGLSVWEQRSVTLWMFFFISYSSQTFLKKVINCVCAHACMTLCMLSDKHSPRLSLIQLQLSTWRHTESSNQLSAPQDVCTVLNSSTSFNSSRPETCCYPLTLLFSYNSTTPSVLFLLFYSNNYNVSLLKNRTNLSSVYILSFGVFTHSLAPSTPSDQSHSRHTFWQTSVNSFIRRLRLQCTLGKLSKTLVLCLLWETWVNGMQ